MKRPLRGNRWKISKAAHGEFRAPAARKSDDTTEKVQRRRRPRSAFGPSNASPQFSYPSPGFLVGALLLCRRYSDHGGLSGTLCARAALPQYGRDIIMESHHEQAQCAWDYCWSRVIECGALLASMVAKECGALP